MSIKSKLLVAATTLSLLGGVGVAGALTAGSASAATPSCGPTCINLYNQQFGKAFYQDVFRQSIKLNQPIILFRSADSDPALDFTSNLLADVSTPSCLFGLKKGEPAGTPASPATCKFGFVIPFTPLTVAQLCALGGGLGAGTCARYASDYVWETQYSPYGVNSGLCVGVATATSGAPVSLQPCGVSAKTWWISDNAHVYFHKGHYYTPWVNAASTNFTQPLVLTYPANGYPTDKPRPGLFVSTQTTFSSGAPAQNQMWGLCVGEVGISC
jgi:hypothetical protein